MGRDVARHWLHHGQMLEAAGEYLSARAAYDAAIAILADATSAATTPASEVETRRELGLAWMNRGNAAQKLGTASSLVEAVEAYDHAITLFGALPPDPSGTSQNHLGAAWLNRGHALLLASDRAAVTSFENAIATLSRLPLGDNPSARRNLAGAHTNLAHALLSAVPEGNDVPAPAHIRPLPLLALLEAVGPALAHGRSGPRVAAPEAPSKLGPYRRGPAPSNLLRAAHSARAALSTINGYEPHHLDFAAMTLRARRALVVALGGLLAAADRDGTPTAELLAEASDTIEEGLALTLTLRPADFRELRPLTERLFRLGVQLYGSHQPHFLGEFVLELMASPFFTDDATFPDIALTALADALTHVRRPQLLVAGTPAADRALLTARSLRMAEEELARRLGRPVPCPGN